MALSPLIRQPNGSFIRQENGSLARFDTEDPNCCCGCCSGTECEHCEDGCTPDAWTVTIPALTVVTGCENCDIVAEEHASINITGSYPGDEYCLEQISACAWRYIAPYTGVVAKVYSVADCDEDFRCWESNELVILLTVRFVLGVSTVQLEAWILMDPPIVDVGCDIPSISEGRLMLFQTGDVTMPSHFCRDGMTIAGLTPIDPPCTKTPGQNFVVSDTGDALLVPCCEEVPL